MMKLLSRLTPLAACLAMASPFALAAEISYESRVTNLAIGVIDLTPGDGADAGYSFIGNGSTGYGVTLEQPGAAPQSTSDTTLATLPGSYTLDGENASVSISSTGRAGDLVARGTLAPAQSADSYASSGLNQQMEIELAPNTALALSGHAFLSLVSQPEVTWPDQGSARIFISISEPATACCVHGSSYQRTLDLHESGGPDDIDEDFYVFMGNATGQATRVVVNINVHGDSRVSPIPEPSTYGMLLAGLIVIGATARRARSFPFSTAQKGH